MTISIVPGSRLEDSPLPKRSKTISFQEFIAPGSDNANADRFAHSLSTPPEDMEWLIGAIKENDNKSLFELDLKFLESYNDRKPPFGFNGLGQLVYARTYARIRPDGTNETWKDTIKRVVEGVFEVQKAYVEKVLKEKWNEEKSQKTAQEMYDNMFNMKFLPPGRGLWAMGTSICRQKGLGAALNNCAFVSTSKVVEDPSKPFVFLMDASMLGVGVGFDTEGAGKITIQTPKQPSQRLIIGDTREGWVESLEKLLKSYFLGEQEVEFDYSAIRPAGLPLKTFGGMSSGPEPLKKMLESVENLLKKDLGKPLSETLIVDIMNLIGKCVVAGNVRRTAEIAFGKPDSIEFLDLKNYDVNPHRAEYGWTSNNSIFAKLGMDYTEACNRVQKNGEPGFAWLENMKAFSRMNGLPDHRDAKVTGGNPCLEQSLESMELCCLVETFPNHCADFEEYKRTLELALLYAKTVTLVTVHWPETRNVMYRNRRIGCSVSGIAQFLTTRGIHRLHRWLELGYQVLHQYDNQLSQWLKVPKSVKLTSVKPSGTISLLAGATPGIHFPESRFYIRRIRMSKDFPMIGPLREAGYKIEPAFGSEDSTVVVEFPVDVGEGIRGQKEVSMWEQLSIAAFMQKHWADNQVSATITFDPVTEGPQLKHALDYFQYQLKGVSFLPRLEYGAFPQMPYEAIDEEKYKQEMQRLRTNLDHEGMPARTHSEILRATEQQGFTTHKMEDAFCDGDKCDLVAMKAARAKAKESSVESS